MRKRHCNFADYFCCIHIFLAKLLICCQTFTSQKLEILYKFDVRFHATLRKSNLSCFTDCTKHLSARALTHRQQTIYWIYTNSYAASTDINLLSLIVPSIDETSSVATNVKLRGETQTCAINSNLQTRRNSNLQLVLFYFSVAKTLAKYSQACG